jgi:Arc/MetJ-type ribon-helix-helix transcriptional regulator
MEDKEKKKQNPEEPEEDETKGPDISDQIREGVKGFRDTISGVGEALGVAMKTVLADREYVVMVRVNKDTRDSLDHLMQAGLFKSRSEAAAFLLASGIKAQSLLFDKIKDKTTEISRLQEELRSLISGLGAEEK